MTPDTHLDPLKVILFSGAGRSGSTLVASLLGEFRGFVCIGEGTSYVLRDSMRARGLPCGCGEPVQLCSFWGALAVSYPRMLEQKIDTMTHLRALPLLLLPWKPRWLRERLERLGRHIEDFFAAVQSKTGAQVIVDASKNPPLAVLMSYAPRLEVHLVHLVRDPRGFVGSRVAPNDPDTRVSAATAIRIWLTRNLASELTKRRGASYTLIRYEDFVSDPRSTLERVAGHALGAPAQADFIEGAHAKFGEQHMLAGNRERIGRTSATVQHRRWKISRRLEFLVGAVLYPVMRRYGYRWADRAHHR